MSRMITRLLAILIMLSPGLAVYSQSEIDPLVLQGYKYYAERDLKKSERAFLKFLKKTPDLQSPNAFRARLGLAYLYLLPSDTFNSSEGRKQLKNIIDNSNDADFKSRAIYLMGRSFHLDRSGNPEDNLKEARVYYKQYLEEYPKGKLKSRVILYIAQTYLRSEEEADVDKAIDLLETFLNSPEGQKDEYAAELALALGGTYQLRKNDMNRAVKYLAMAVDKGLAESLTVSTVLGKIATIYDKRLHQPQKALKYYRALAEQFPVDSRINVIKKRIKEIESGHE